MTGDSTYFRGILTSPLWQLTVARNSSAWSDAPYGEAFRSWLGGLPDSMRRPTSYGKAFFWNYGPEESRLMLLSDETLRRLALTLGVLLHARELAGIVMREDRREVCAVVGEDLFRFALSRGQYEVGSPGELFAQVEPDLPPGLRCQRHGWALLSMIRMDTADREKAYAERLAGLAGPLQTPPVEDLPPLTESRRLSFWHLTRKTLLHEVDPGCAPYFS